MRGDGAQSTYPSGGDDNIRPILSHNPLRGFYATMTNLTVNPPLCFLYVTHHDMVPRYFSQLAGRIAAP